jgi:hypothetical protein
VVGTGVFVGLGVAVGALLGMSVSTPSTKSIGVLDGDDVLMPITGGALSGLVGSDDIEPPIDGRALVLGPVLTVTEPSIDGRALVLGSGLTVGSLVVGSPKNPPIPGDGLDVVVGPGVGVDSPVVASSPVFVVGTPKKSSKLMVGMLLCVGPGETVGTLVSPSSFMGSPVCSMAPLADVGLDEAEGVFVVPKNSSSPSVGLPVGIAVPGSTSGSGICSATDGMQRHNANTATVDSNRVVVREFV